MEVAVEVDDGGVKETITLYRVASVTDGGKGNEMEVVIHEDTDIPDEIELCVQEGVDLQTHENARIEEPGTIWFSNVQIVHASEDY